MNDFVKLKRIQNREKKILELFNNDIKNINDLKINNKIFILKFVKKYGWCLEFVLDMFKNDDDIVFEACKNCGSSIQFADKKFRDNRELILYIVKNDGFNLIFASEKLKNDVEIVYESIKHDIRNSLDYSSERFQNELRKFKYNQKIIEQYLYNHYIGNKLFVITNIIKYIINVDINIYYT